MSDLNACGLEYERLQPDSGLLPCLVICDDDKHTEGSSPG
jgi:hypothetical protein